MAAGLPASEALGRSALARVRDAHARESGDSGRFSLVVDLADEPLGPRWLRGAATLAILSCSALSLAPGLDLFSTAYAHSIAPDQQFQMNGMLGGGSADPAAPPSPDPLPLAKPVVASTDSAVRVQGPVTEGLYWSLRDAGVSAEVAAAYLQALATRIDVGSDVAPYDRFDLVVSKKPEGGAQPLLYAALHRVNGPDVALMKWNAGGRANWFDTGARGVDQPDALMAPVGGRITSGFGVRRHPILRFARMHSGIDFGAVWGSPIVAAADGVIIGSGWSGGYGRQVQLAHGSGIVTTYSHMSATAASAGETVRQGQVIGYVGSTGLSTGPHLHFEVRVNGQAVDPMQVQLQRRQQVSGAERQAFNARLKRLLAIGAKA